MSKKIAVYPGSFDPVTNGHIDIVKRASEIFDEVVVAVLENREKMPIFSVAERKVLIGKSVKKFRNVRVDSFSGLLVEYMKKNRMHVAIRGLRAVSDLEYEFKIAHTNRTLYPKMETVFLMPGDRYVYLTATTVREIAAFGANLENFVPPHVSAALKKKFAQQA